MLREPILQVEDDENDIFFMQHAFNATGITIPIQVARDGTEAIQYLAHLEDCSDRTRFPLPCLILLDLKLPRLEGMDVLAWLRHKSNLPHRPVIVFSSSAEQVDIQAAYRLGANAYVQKPVSVAERIRFAQGLKDFWLQFIKSPAR